MRIYDAISTTHMHVLNIDVSKIKIKRLSARGLPERSPTSVLTTP